MERNGKRVVIVGGVAAGMKAASRLRRLDPAARITVLERGEKVSYGACALPYYLQGLFPDLDEVRRTPAGALRDEAFFRKVKGVEVRTRTEALAIDRESRMVRTRNLADGSETDLPYDALVLATGNRPILPPVPGIELAGVQPLKGMEDAAAIAGGAGQREDGGHRRRRPDRPGDGRGPGAARPGGDPGGDEGPGAGQRPRFRHGRPGAPGAAPQRGATAPGRAGAAPGGRERAGAAGGHGRRPATRPTW